MRGLDINVKLVEKKVVNFIREEFGRRSFKRAVVGVSGGVDSALVAKLAAMALGPKNLTCLFMPYFKDEKVRKETEDFVRAIGAEFRVIDISPMIDAYFASAKDASRIRRGNKMARERMSILFDHAKLLNALVLGTSNKTETALGYFTLHGDSACAVNPLGSLYKTQVWQLARAVGIPEEIVEKEPSADLWPGQTDEGEMGIAYKDADRLLFCMLDRKYTEKRLKRLGFPAEFIDKVKGLIKASKFKRTPPAVPKL
jgi:NAD+ synthase